MPGISHHSSSVVRVWLWLAIVAIWAGAVVRSAEAQAIRLELRETALETALQELRAQAGIDIVFAERLVDGQYASCRYEGSEAEAALACVLRETDLQAERVRWRQYVLVPRRDPEPGALAATSAERTPRGLLTGFVADVETGQRLPGAHVYLTDLRLGTVTNDAGYFAIAQLPQGSYSVRVSYLGYQTLVVALPTDTVSHTIRLSPKALETDGVVVEGDRSERVDVAAVPGVVDVAVEDLDRLPSITGEHDLLRTLQWFPGVQKAGELNGGLVVRGGEPDQNLYLLDGAPVYHHWHAFSLISTFQTETFRDVKLYRGTFPAEHGGRLSAVLDAQMKDGHRSDPSASVALSVLSGRFMIESPITGNSSFMLSGRRSYLDKLIGREHPVEDDLGRRDTLRTGYYFYDWSAKVAYRPGARHRLTGSYYYGGDALDLRLPFDLSFDFSSWLRPAELFFEIDQGWENRVLTVRHEFLSSRRLFVTSAAYYAGYKAREGAFLRPTSSARLASDYRVRLHDLGLRVDAEYYPALGHEVQAGLQTVSRRFWSALDATVLHSPSSIDTLDQTSRLHAAELVGYVQDTWQPSPRWTIQPGLRASFFGGGRHARLDPSLNVRFLPLPGRLALRAGMGSQVQYLHRIRDRYSFMYDLVSSRWIPAGDAVRPSHAWQASLGVELHPASWITLTSDVYARLSSDILLPEDVFRTKDGLVGPGIEVGTLLGQYTPGEGKAYGLELVARIERGPWRAWFTYAGGRTLNRAPELGEETFRPARFDVPRSFRGVIHRTLGAWEVTTAAELRSGYPHTVPVARYALGDPFTGTDAEAPPTYLYRPLVNNGRLPPYVRFDLVVGRGFELLGASWRAQVYVFNVTNRRNVISRSYDPTGDLVRVEDRRGFPLLPLFEVEMEL